MKNYIWEKSFKKTWLSVRYNEFDQGVLEVANYVRLLDGETRDIWCGYDKDFSQKDKEILTQDKYVLPYVYFSFQGKPFLKYEKEAEIVEKITKERGITIQNYFDWINLDEIREKAEEEYKKSPILKEYQEWENKNETFFQKLGELTNEFNGEYIKDGDLKYWKMAIFEWDKENGILCFSLIYNRMDLHDPAVVLGLTTEKRKELHQMSLVIFKNFGDFLKTKFINN